MLLHEAILDYPIFSSKSTEVTVVEEEQIKTLLSTESLVEYALSDKISDSDLDLYVNALDRFYRVTGIDIIPDETYDKLFEKAKERGIKIQDMNEVGTFQHTYPLMRGTLNKIHFGTEAEKGNDNRVSFEKYIERVLRNTGRTMTELRKEPVRLSLKVDGVSAVFEHDKSGLIVRALKRGDTERNLADNIPLYEGFNISELIGEEYLTDEEGAVKCEVYMSNEDFVEIQNQLSREFESPRSAVTSIINSKNDNRHLINFLTLSPLQVYRKGDEFITYAEGNVSAPYYITTLGDIIDNFDSVVKDSLQKISEDLDIPADGTVISFMNDDIKRELGRKDSINQYEIAYKFPPKKEMTKLLDVEFSVGSLGSITPVANIEPIVIGGHTIDSPSIGSMGRFNKLMLKKGQNVDIRYDVVPYLEPVYDSLYDSLTDYISAPTECPACGNPLSEYNSELKCDSLSCDAVDVGRILNYIVKTDIGHISKSTVEKFNQLGILSNILDLYKLTEHKKYLSQLEGFGEKSITNILDSIEEKKTLPEHEFYGALGIRGQGVRVFKKVFEHISEEDFFSDIKNTKLDKVIGKVSKIPGIGELSATKIVGGVYGHIEMIEDIKNINGFRLLKDHREYRMKFLFTKFRDDDLVRALDQRDIQVVDSYNKSVDVVVIPKEGEHSGKSKKALKDGKKVITRDELEAILFK